MLIKFIKRVFSYLFFEPIGSSDSTKEKKLEISLVIREEALDRFIALREKTGCTNIELLRYSLVLYEYHFDEYQKGTKFFKREIGGEITPIEVFGEEKKGWKKVVCISDKRF